jgi:hypothetical protein
MVGKPRPECTKLQCRNSRYKTDVEGRMENIPQQQKLISYMQISTLLNSMNTTSLWPKYV